MSGEKNSNLLDPVDFIDLTQEQESPVSFNRRGRRLRNSISSDGSADAGNRTRNSKGRKKSSARKQERQDNGEVLNVIDLISLDESIKENNGVSSPGPVEKKKMKSLSACCPICFENLTSDRKPMSTKCGHMYCAECISTSLKATKKCPTCKNPITEKSCIRLFF